MLTRFKQVALFVNDKNNCRHVQIAHYFDEVLLNPHPLHPGCCDNCGKNTYSPDLKKDCQLVTSLIGKLGQPLISLVVEILRGKVSCQLICHL